MGYEMARQLKVPNIFLERQDGVMTLRRGFRVGEGSRVLVVEDTVTTGGSVREVMEIVRAGGGSVVQVAALVDRTRGRVDFGVPFTALCQADVNLYPAGDCPLCRAGAPLDPPRNP